MRSIKNAALLGLALLTPSAWAATTWNYGVGAFLDGASTPQAQSASAYSTTGSGGTLLVASICNWGSSGYGIDNTSETGTCGSGSVVPQHSADNSGQTDMFLLRFSSAVSLASLTIGWNGTDNDTNPNTSGTQYADSDISVLAYTGNSNPVPIGGLTPGDLLINGWKAIGNYDSVGAQPGNTQAVNTTIFSSWWLISAYNSAFNVAGAEVSGSPAMGSNYNSTTKANYDYFKLVSVAGTLPPPPPGVPEPGSLALVALALAGIAGARRKQQAG